MPYYTEIRNSEADASQWICSAFLEADKESILKFKELPYINDM